MNLSLQTMVALWASILGPIFTLMGFMWHHFNNKFEKIDQKFEKIDEKFEKIDEKIDGLKGDVNGLKVEMGKLSVKIDADAVRDRVSRIEGQLFPNKMIAFEEPRPSGITKKQMGIMGQKSVVTGQF